MKFPEITCHREDCRIKYLGSRTTLMGSIPVYDKKGNLISKDPNIRTNCFTCEICMGYWETKE